MQRYWELICYLDQMNFVHIFDHEIRDIKKNSDKKINIKKIMRLNLTTI